MSHEAEVAFKLARVREVLQEAGAAAARLRGTDWFAWATAGGSPTVLLSAETGVAEVLVTLDAAWVLTDEIEAGRLRDEELPVNFEVFAHPWAEGSLRDAFVREAARGGRVLSDRPSGAEGPLPPALMAAKRRLLAPEIARYREVGRRAAQAMTEALEAAQPDWTEYELAGAGAEALLACGLEPCLTLVAGERRLPLYRHATARGDRLGARAMMVFCARGAGLFANLTRFVAFDTLPEADRRRHAALLDIEGAALEASRPGALLSEVYAALEAAYRVAGYPEAIREHHQGGSTGYLAREVVAAPGTAVTLEAGTALAWNPSLRGAKLEDTMLLHEDGRLEVLTVDPRWPVVEHAGLKRPLVLER